MKAAICTVSDTGNSGPVRVGDVTYRLPQWRLLVSFMECLKKVKHETFPKVAGRNWIGFAALIYYGGALVGGHCTTSL